MKYALRQLAKNPGFTIVALATLALGIGVNTTAFTALNRLLLQALPFPDAGRIVQIWASTPRQEFAGQSPGDYVVECDENTVFDNVAAYNPGVRASFAEPGQAPVQIGANRVTANFFPLFGIKPQIGRMFTDQEDRHLDPLAVISNIFWREHYGSDPKVLGRTAKLDSKVYTIVGVLPAYMDDPTLFGGRPAFWLLDGTRVNTNYRDGAWYHVAARLKPGVTLKQAQTSMTAMAIRLSHDFPKTNKDRALKVVPYPTDSMGTLGSQLTWLVMALSGMVLLIACVNLANLQLVRTSRRSQEIATRLALGCPRSTLIRMLITESLILSVAGGALGMVIAYWSKSYVARFFDYDMPLNPRVVGFAFAVAMLTGLVFGTVPAWIASRTDLNSALKTSGRGSTSDRSRHWLRQGLVVVELALALTLLAGAAFFVNGIYKVTHVDLGWQADNVLLGFIELDHDHYGESKDPRSVAFGDSMVAALSALPGVEAAGLTFNSPAWGFGRENFRVEGRPVPEPGKEEYAGENATGPGFFKIYGIKLLQGRDFLASDRLGSPPVVIINESMARKYWPGENPIGKRIGRTDSAAPDWAEVIGVMADFKGAADFYDPSSVSAKYMRPWAQNSHRFIAFHVRTTGDPVAMKDSVRKAIGILKPDVAVSNLESVREIEDEDVSFVTFLRRILLEISALGLLLAAVGIYGVVANLASERTKEIGIRMALGAEARGIVWLFLKNGLQLAAVGTIVGLVASFLLLNFLAKMLPFVPGNDPRVVVEVALFLVAVALLACWLPAWRTTKVSPTIALRTE
jgi:putative ABC transport system permease protein